MIYRHASPRLLRLLEGFPIVTVTGPRQSGKTTLVRSLLASKPYVSLEAPAQREFARAQPADFLLQFPEGAVIDEAQNAPELFSQLQSVVDASGIMGQFVLTGSHNLSLLSGVTQSLAGRTALVELLPLSIAELRDARLLSPDYATQLVKGFYPALYSRAVDPYEWLQAYLVTYAERDARQLAAIADLGAFQRFLKLTAARTGQLLNMQSLASDAGISDKTVKHWLSILETCYLIHFVRPHFANFGKRLTKSSKLYMTDVGLAAALLGVRNADQMQHHPLRGAFFETMVVNEFLKSRCNAGVRDPLYFWRDNIGTEIDLILERGTEVAAIEVKSGITVASDSFGNLKKWKKYATERGSFSAIYPGLVYGGEDRFTRDGVDVMPWRAL
ncbi:MAG: ATP-binding protein [Polaromonas sp.]|uniref:ATP-binding protein n=1 Tax=Polaromonas sp. TaxID=1869339 RepID=UPI002734D875|nr:ATP-binding protein [Polaromonas sp.]MDP2817617.1 ATP-binding protein [Polaromonas sp.]